MPSLGRRSFLARAGAVAALPGAMRRPLAPRPDDPAGAPFEWGVASSDPTDSAVLLCTRVTPGPAPVSLRWEVARDPELADVVATGRVSVGRATDHGAVVDANGLAAGSTQWYAFTTDDGRGRGPRRGHRRAPPHPLTACGDRGAEDPAVGAVRHRRGGAPTRSIGISVRLGGGDDDSRAE